MDNIRTVTRQQLLLLLDQMQRGGLNPLFGEYLRIWRREMGLEPSAFARQMQVSAQTIFRWERGFSLNPQQELRLREAVDPGRVTGRPPHQQPLCQLGTGVLLSKRDS